MEEVIETEIKATQILLCVDEGRNSIHAFNKYLEHFYQKDHELIILNVYTFNPMFGPMRVIPPQDTQVYELFIKEVKAKSQQITDLYQNECVQQGIPSSAFNIAKADTIGHSIVRFARDNHINFIVMGQRGASAFRRTIFGSVSDFVLHHAHLSTIIVPSPYNGQQCFCNL